MLMTERAAKLSPPDAGQQGPNRDETGFDPVQGFAFLESIALNWREHNRLDVLVFRALAQLSMRNPMQASSGFSSFDIAQMVGEIRGTDWSSQDDKDKASDDVRKYWARLLETWVTKEEGIHQGLLDHGFARVPVLDKTKGGGTGRVSLYRIDWIEPDAAPPVPAAALPVSGSDAKALRYVCEDISDAGWLARVFARGYPLYGWRRWSMVACVAVPLLATLGSFIVALLGVIQWNRLGTPVVLQSAAAFLIALAATWIVVGPILQVVARRIVVAPWWMQDDEDSRLLEHRSSPRYSDTSIKAVRYTSSCPICGGHVVAKSGGFEFWGRVVGRCKHAPVEHVFSFDHVTRSGKPLR